MAERMARAMHMCMIISCKHDIIPPEMIGLRQVDIFTDGACSGNPGPGGWGAVLRYGDAEKALSGGEKDTTNNRMELAAAIMALSALKEPCAVTLTSDSKYLCDGMGKGWAKGWKTRGWKKSDGDPALNPDLWDKLLTLCQTHAVNFVWVRGHNGHPENERCDELARKEIEHLQ